MRKLIIATTAAAAIATSSHAMANTKVNPCAAAKPLQISQNNAPCASNCAANMPCAASACNPSNPCASMGCNPCNPCGAMCNPCNPCAATNPCAVQGCNPCNPNQ